MPTDEPNLANNAVRTRQFVVCDQCGMPFERDVSYPVTTREDADGSLRVFSFCDEACQDAWSAEH